MEFATSRAAQCPGGTRARVDEPERTNHSALNGAAGPTTNIAAVSRTQARMVLLSQPPAVPTRRTGCPQMRRHRHRHLPRRARRPFGLCRCRGLLLRSARPRARSAGSRARSASGSTYTRQSGNATRTSAPGLPHVCAGGVTASHAAAPCSCCARHACGPRASRRCGTRQTSARCSSGARTESAPTRSVPPSSRRSRSIGTEFRRARTRSTSSGRGTDAGRAPRCRNTWSCARVRPHDPIGSDPPHGTRCDRQELAWRCASTMEWAKRAMRCAAHAKAF